MKTSYLHYGLLQERLERYKVLKRSGIKQSGTLPIYTDYHADENIRSFNLGDSFTPALRFHFIDESPVYGDRIEHKGWPAGKDVIRGVVFRLPNDNVLAGWATKLGGIALVDKLLFKNEYMAVVHADYLAKKEADAWTQLSEDMPLLMNELKVAS